MDTCRRCGSALAASEKACPACGLAVEPAASIVQAMDSMFIVVSESIALHGTLGGEPLARVLRRGEPLVMLDTAEVGDDAWVRALLADGTQAWFSVRHELHPVLCLRVTGGLVTGHESPGGEVIAHLADGALLLVIGSTERGDAGWWQVHDPAGRTVWVRDDDRIQRAQTDGHRPIYYKAMGVMKLGAAGLVALLGLATRQAQPAPWVVSGVLALYGCAQIAYGNWRGRRGIGPDEEAQQRLRDFARDRFGEHLS